MWRKFIIGLFVFIMIISASTFGYASNVDSSKYQVIAPEEEASASKNKVVLISGKAPEGTEVKIEVYGAIDLKGNKYSLAKLPEEEDYTLISSLDIESGALGFAEEVELISGINKIVINFNVDGISPIEKIIYHYEVQEVVESLRNTSILPSTN